MKKDAENELEDEVTFLPLNDATLISMERFEEVSASMDGLLMRPGI